MALSPLTEQEAEARPEPSEALAVEKLTVYRARLPVVRDITLRVRPGGALGVLGRNGAGKTTLLEGIMGLLDAEGQIRLAGDNLAPAPAWVRARKGLALVPQGRQLIPGLTVEQNLRLAWLAPLGNGPVLDVYQLFPALSRLLKRKAGVLSGGEQQQVAIGRALLRRPTVLLLDEPTEGLAPAVVNEITAVLKRLMAAGLTLVIAEQHHHVVTEICAEFVVLRGGEVAAQGVTESALLEQYLSTL